MLQFDVVTFQFTQYLTVISQFSPVVKIMFWVLLWFSLHDILLFVTVEPGTERCGLYVVVY